MIEPKTSYEKEIREYAKTFGGFFNAHAHGDRAFTRRDEFYSHVGLSVGDIEKLSLPEKQSLVWALHSGSAFDESCIRERMNKLLEDSIGYGVRRLDTCVDTTYNTKLKAFYIAKELKEKYKERIDLRLGVYNVSGFKDSFSERFEIFEAAAKDADFIVALAEKDRKKNHIGEKQHNVYLLNLGIKFNKSVHFHVGQENSPGDKGVELLFECIDWVYNAQHRLEKKQYPQNFLIHNISSSCSSEENFKEHCKNLKDLNLGVICCPSAALSMRQDKNQNAPIHNSITRIWDFALRDIPIFLGTDNINDVFVPSSTPDMYDEIFLLSHAARGYNTRVLSKIACGEKLDNFDKGRIRNGIIY